MPSSFHREDAPNDSDEGLVKKALGAAAAAYEAVMGKHPQSAASGTGSIEDAREQREGVEKELFGSNPTRPHSVRKRDK
jgi:hypothetical protein